MNNRFNLTRLVSGTLIFWLALAGASAGEKNSFAVAGVELGMGFERVRDIYPASEIEEQAANCYRYGVAIKDASMARRVLLQRTDTGVLVMTFASPRRGGRLTRIHYDHRVDPATFNFRALLTRLTARYGSHDQVLHRRKMEPAGRIIGFEWHGPAGARLRVVLRNDHHTSPAAVRLSFLARAAARDPLPTRQPVLCASDH